MRRKTDFFTAADSSRSTVTKALDEHLRTFQDDKKRELALKTKKEQEKKAREAKEAEEAAKRKQGETQAQVEEVTDEEAERIIKEQEAKKKAASEDQPMKQDSESESPEKESEGEEKKEDKGAKPNSANGGETDKYRWGQTLEEISMFVYLPDGVAARQLDVDIKPQNLKIGLKG
jgi:membrane protein involved in colicin uptake